MYWASAENAAIVPGHSGSGVQVSYDGGEQRCVPVHEARPGVGATTSFRREPTKSRPGAWRMSAKPARSTWGTLTPGTTRRITNARPRKPWPEPEPGSRWL